MTAKTFRAMVVTETGEKKFARRIAERSVSELPAGEVLIRVHYSSLNYKDALSASGHKGVTRAYPHTPGIDAAGAVEHSSSPSFQVGDEVIVTGYDLGMNTAGGFGQYIRVPADWVVRLPAELSLRQAMSFGTAGFTAAQSVLRLERHGLAPGQGEVLVTGATGGVGSLAVAILAKAGYQVVAATGKTHEKEFLTFLGAKEIIAREAVNDTSGKPLLSERWAGAVDTVGGNVLSSVIRSTCYRGAVTCCGLVASPELSLTVYPFILRGVTLFGIDSAKCPMAERLKIWERLSGAWRIPQLDALTRECPLSELDGEIERILAGKLRGRVVVNLGA